jgi:magnesium transporter
VARGVRWIDLLDASRDELVDEAPVELHWSALEQLLAPAPDRATARPRFESHGDYVFGVLVVPVAVPEDDRVFYQEIDFVLTPAVALTVRKTPPDEEPFSIEQVQAACEAHGAPSAGLVLYYLVDDVAERYLRLLDSLNDEIDELESGIESWPNARIRRRLSDLREDILQIRRTLGPTRDAVRRIADGRVDVGDDELFDRQLELSFADAHDKLLHSVDSLDVARDLISSARDYHQSKIAQDQNEVVKKLAVVASLLLLPTFIVGVYGQNFEHMPELGWRLGYGLSWAIIALTTGGQLAFFRWKRWI